MAAIAISDQLIAPLALPLDGERTIIVLIALATLVAGALAAFMQDDLRHAVGYLVIADAGIVLLGFAALDPAAWGPTRVWLVAMAASKTAVAAWAAVMEDRFSTRSVPDLRGWLRHSPILGGRARRRRARDLRPARAGWRSRRVVTSPGSPARTSPGSSSSPGSPTLPTYVRLIAVGTGPATSRVRGARARALGEAAPPGDAAGDRRGAALDRGRSGRCDRGLRQGHAVAAPGGTAAHVGRLGRQSAGRRVARALRRDRTELLAAAVLALAILAGLTSWGALDLGGAASEAAPTARAASD